MQFNKLAVLCNKQKRQAKHGFSHFFAVIALLTTTAVGNSASAATITVNPGQTIASGIAAAASGDTVVVNAGSYTGDINPKTGVTVRANGVVNVAGSTNLTCNNCSVIGFKFDHGSAWMNGNDILLEGNDFNGKGGGEDYAGVFGSRITVRRNYFHGVRIPEDLQPVAGGWEHNDVIQFWNNNGETLHDLIIEENIFTDYVQGVFLANETGVLSSMSNITVRNNVFWGTDFISDQNLIGNPSHGLFVGKANITGVSITNNIFRKNANSVSLYAMTSAVVQGNIIVDGGTAYAVGDGTQDSAFNRGTIGNVLWSNGWNGYPAQGPDKYINPTLQNVNSLLGADGTPWTTDDGWLPTNTAATAYGPQVTLGGGGTPTTTVTAVNDSFSGINEDSAATLLTVLSNDTVSPSGTLSIASVGAASKGATLSISGTSISYRPAANTFGAETFSYTAREAGGSTATATVTVNVTEVNDPPTAVANTYTVAANSAATTMTVLANDSIAPDAGETLTVAAVTTPNQGGTCTINTDTSLRYTPRANFSGTETFSYTNSDGRGGTATTNVTVTITAAPNTPPTANIDSFSGILEDSSANILTVLANDSDPDGNSLTITSRTAPSNGGTVTIGAGTLSYTPAANFNGTETFSYTVSDGNGGTASAGVSVSVLNVNDAPVAVNDAYSVLGNSSANALAVLTNDTDADNDTLSISDLTATNNGGTVSVSGSGLSYSPAANFIGTETFSYTVSDGNSAISTATVTITVTDNNTAPVATADAFTVSMNSTSNTFSVCLNDSDPDVGDTFTVAGFGVPDNGGSISMDTPTTVKYSPASNFAGTEKFTYTIKDVRGATASAQVTITVKDTSPTAGRDRYKVHKRSTTLRGVDKKYRLPVLRNDVSNNGTPLSLAGAVQDARAIHGLVEIQGNDLLYTPPADFIGSEVFLYTIRDANDQTATGEVTVEVTDQIGLTLCDDTGAIIVEMAELYYDFGLLGADLDADSIPDDFMLEAMQIIACFDSTTSLGIAAQTAYAINLLMFDQETNAAALSTYREAIAAMMSMNTGMQGALNQTLDVSGFSLTQTYQAVTCDETGVCMPQPIPGKSLSEGFQIFDESRSPIEEPFAGESDIDHDGLTNAEEYANVVAAGGSSAEYANSATDPALDGTTLVIRGEPAASGGGGCFIATAAYGTPLASQINVLRDVRDRDLLSNSLGATFVDTYYRLSPPLARLVADHPALAALVRLALVPVILVGKALLAAPMLVLAALLAMMTAAALRLHKRRQHA